MLILRLPLTNISCLYQSTDKNIGIHYYFSYDISFIYVSSRRTYVVPRCTLASKGPAFWLFLFLLYTAREIRILSFKVISQPKIFSLIIENKIHFRWHIDHSSRRRRRLMPGRYVLHIASQNKFPPLSSCYVIPFRPRYGIIYLSCQPSVIIWAYMILHL